MVSYMRSEFLLHMKRHFVMDHNNGRRLATKGDEDIKFGDVVIANVGMNMILPLVRGSKLLMEIPFVRYGSDHRLSALQGVPSTILLCPIKWSQVVVGRTRVREVAKQDTWYESSSSLNGGNITHKQRLRTWKDREL